MNTVYIVCFASKGKFDNGSDCSPFIAINVVTSAQNDILRQNLRLSFTDFSAIVKFPKSNSVFFYVDSLIKKNDLTVLAKVTNFFKWRFENGDEEAKKLHYVPLPSVLKTDIGSYWGKAGVK
jgi:ABC-type phosphate transport system substrate-binding protein